MIRGLIAFSPQRRLHGLHVAIIGEEANSAARTEEVFARIEEALRVLSTDPLNLLRAQRYLRWIVIATGPFGQYRSRLRSCEIGSEVVLGQSPEWVASIVVHEACHARTDHLRHYELSRREELCVRTQLRFLEGFPGTEWHRENLRAHLKDGQWFQPRGKGMTALLRLRALRAPEWVLRWAERKVATLE